MPHSQPVHKSNSESGAQLFAKSFLGDDTAVLAKTRDQSRVDGVLVDSAVGEKRREI